MGLFVLSLFPLDVLDEIWDLIESVSEGFLTYSCGVIPPMSESCNSRPKYCEQPPSATVADRLSRF